MHEVLNISGTVLRSFALSATFQKKNCSSTLRWNYDRNKTSNDKGLSGKWAIQAPIQWAANQIQLRKVVELNQLKFNATKMNTISWGNTTTIQFLN